MKMIKTSCGYMTPMEAKIIGDIARDERRQNKKGSHQVVSSFNLPNKLDKEQSKKC